MLTKRQKQIFEYIKKFIKQKGYSPSLEDIRRHFRLKSKSTVHQHLETLKDRGYISKTENLARGIEITKSKKQGELISIPLFGTIAAGEPIEAAQNNEKISVSKSLLSKSGGHYALKVAGDSMIEDGIYDGDTVVIRNQPDVDNGETAVALINGDQVTLKKIYKEKNGYRLQPANAALRPLFAKNVVIQGKVISIIRRVDELENKPMEYMKQVIPLQIPNKYQKPLPLNKIICGDTVETMSQFPSNSVDLVITSPPYDSLRDYRGFSYDLHKAGEQIFRVLKPGGVAVMVIQDQTKNFGKTLTSFRTILDWCDIIGFKLFETVIYRKYGAEGAWWNKRFRVDHEYMPIFLKGERPQYFNKEHLKIPSKHGGKTMTGGGTRLTNGVRIATRSITINPMKCRGTIWEYLTAGDGSRLKHQHPATFPNQLPYDFINCFCPAKGVVLDPYVGSGTTTVAAKNLGRDYIGIDIAEEYCQLARQRIKEEASQTKMTI